MTALPYFFLSAAAVRADTYPPTLPDSKIMAIVVSGKVPGFTQEQLAAYLANKMQEEVASPWHFVEGKEGNGTYPNRVVWSIKALRKIWLGGTHYGFPSPTNSVTYLRAEVKLYINDAYQMTLDTHPTFHSGVDDQAISELVHNVSHAIFVTNTRDMK
jgi:hypothetical protein